MIVELPGRTLATIIRLGDDEPMKRGLFLVYLEMEGGVVDWGYLSTQSYVPITGYISIYGKIKATGVYDILGQIRHGPCRASLGLWLGFKAFVNELAWQC